MIARGFDEVGQRFNKVEQRLDDHDERFAQIDERFLLMDQRFTALEQKVDAGFKSVREDINALAADHFPRADQEDLKRRVERLETHAGLSHSLQAA